MIYAGTICPGCGAPEPAWNAANAFDARDAIIEECARVMEGYIPGQYSLSARMAFAAAIRALKERP